MSGREQDLPWLMPGQGSDLRGLSAWARRSAVVRARVQQAGRLAQCDALRLLATGGPGLHESAALQPILVASLIGIAEILRRAGKEPRVCAGHSLGQLPALAVAGAIDFDDAIELARARGLAMGEAARTCPSGMLALRADAMALEQALDLGRTRGKLWLSGRNAPERWLLSGEDAALCAVQRRFPAARLNVEGAWHSPSMQGATPAWQSALDRVPIHQPRLDVIDGETGACLRHPDDIRRSLMRQLTCPLDWTRVCGELRRFEATQVVTIGPGKVLRELTFENLGRGVSVFGTDTFELTTGHWPGETP